MKSTGTVPPTFMFRRRHREALERSNAWLRSFLVGDADVTVPPNPVRQGRSAMFGNPLWVGLIEARHHANSGEQVVWVEPFLGWRLAAYFESLHPLPWHIRKRALREAMSGLLPADVLSRPKVVRTRSSVTNVGASPAAFRTAYPTLQQLFDEVDLDPLVDVRALRSALDVQYPPEWWPLRLQRLVAYLTWRRNLRGLGVRG